MATLENGRLKFYHMEHCPFSGPIKLLLAYKNFTYEEEEIPLSEWLLRREEIITCRVPALQIHYPNGKQEWMTEATAIMRCLGEQYRLLGRTDMDKYYCDRIIGKLHDAGNLLHDFYKYKKYHEDDQDDYKTYKEEFFKGIAIILEELEKMLNETRGDYAASNEITIADFYLLDFIDFLRANRPELLKPYPNLTKWRKHLMEENQSVARFTAARSWMLI